MDRVRLLKEGPLRRQGCAAHDDAADASLLVIALHCDITDVIAAAPPRQPRRACCSEVALASGRKLRAHRFDAGDPAGDRAANRLRVILLKEVQPGAEANQRAVLQ